MDPGRQMIAASVAVAPLPDARLVQDGMNATSSGLGGAASMSIVDATSSGLGGAAAPLENFLENPDGALVDGQTRASSTRSSSRLSSSAPSSASPLQFVGDDEDDDAALVASRNRRQKTKDNDGGAAASKKLPSDGRIASLMTCAGYTARTEWQRKCADEIQTRMRDDAEFTFMVHSLMEKMEKVSRPARSCTATSKVLGRCQIGLRLNALRKFSGNGRSLVGRFAA